MSPVSALLMQPEKDENLVEREKPGEEKEEKDVKTDDTLFAVDLTTINHKELPDDNLHHTNPADKNLPDDKLENENLPYDKVGHDNLPDDNMEKEKLPDEQLPGEDNAVENMVDETLPDITLEHRATLHHADTLILPDGVYSIVESNKPPNGIIESADIQNESQRVVVENVRDASNMSLNAVNVLTSLHLNFQQGEANIVQELTTEVEKEVLSKVEVEEVMIEIAEDNEEDQSTCDNKNKAGPYKENSDESDDEKPRKKRARTSSKKGSAKEKDPGEGKKKRSKRRR